MDFTSYEDIAGRGAMFKYVIEENLMPPWYLDSNTGPWKNDLSLTVKEKAMLLKWADAGFPRKDKGKDVLETAWMKKRFEKKAQTSADYIIRLPEKVMVPAEGFSIYKRFVVQTNFKKDKWIKDVQFTLKPKVIHHFAIYVMKPTYIYSKKNENFDYHNTTSFNKSFDYHTQAINFIRNSEFKNNTADNEKDLYKNAGIKLPLNSKLVLEIHYEPIGKKVIDDYTQVAIGFHKKPPPYEVMTHYFYAKNINIPANTSNYKVEREDKIKEDRLLVGLNTHMHLRGKASSVFIIDPQGVKKRIFGIDPWTISFEQLYKLKKPLIISKGSTIKCINWFDNSIKNKLNPNPEKNVIEGLFLKNEMSNCVFKWLVPANQNSKHIFWKLLY